MAEDTADPRNGPYGRTCDNKGAAVDIVRFDASFACDCAHTIYTGSNCETKTLPSAEVDSGPIVGAAFSVVLLAAALAVVVRQRRAYLASIAPTDFDERVEAMLAKGELLPEQVQNNRAKTPREINRRWLTLVDKIGHGNFGEVWKGTLDDKDHVGVPEYMVAAKTVLDTANSPEAKDDLLQEATVMANVGTHPNLVSLIGVITTGDPYVVSLCLV